jgi:hypothetical protein
MFGIVAASARLLVLCKARQDPVSHCNVKVVTHVVVLYFFQIGFSSGRALLDPMIFLFAAALKVSCFF